MPLTGEEEEIDMRPDVRRDLDPHRIQMFSFEEIWQNVVSRLIELKVMRDPEVVKREKAAAEMEQSDSSSDYEEEFNFIGKAREREGRIFAGKVKAGATRTTMKDQMRRNDFALLNRAISLVASHERFNNRLSKLDDDHGSSH